MMLQGAAWRVENSQLPKPQSKVGPSMRIGFLIGGVATLQPTFAGNYLAWSAHHRGHEVCFVTADELSFLDDGSMFATTLRVRAGDYAKTGPVYSRRQPEKTALYRVMQENLLTFEQQWTDEGNGRTLPTLVTEELHKYLDCGILARGSAHLYCDD